MKLITLRAQYQTSYATYKLILNVIQTMRFIFFTFRKIRTIAGL